MSPVTANPSALQRRQKGGHPHTRDDHTNRTASSNAVRLGAIDRDRPWRGPFGEVREVGAALHETGQHLPVAASASQSIGPGDCAKRVRATSHASSKNSRIHFSRLR